MSVKKTEPAKPDLWELEALLKKYLAPCGPGTSSARSATQKDLDSAIGDSSGLIAEEVTEDPWPTWEDPSPSSSSSPS
ncbi:hypothetical protein FLAG1_05959 [Fusarium langsethiae]|uniref:Uncharacterized protein n=1 Tax=Fusarium langsethiae TaxID=179993 RepID=A0A0M9EWP0_FUSLA|nr:hypothetical protein FLAG1_05959 [Fusarium langsethiae]GKU03563.1 unnamed protein product [Fusarium langsethiae]GKU17609.1 unnamed protein product [Fusarium langsethiae]